jgi:hypothetical protein
MGKHAPSPTNGEVLLHHTHDCKRLYRGDFVMWENKRMIFLLRGPAVIAVERRHGESCTSTHAASFFYGPCRSKSDPI